MFYGLQFLLFIFLLLKDNFAEPRNEETEAAVLQAAGFVKNGPADAQTVRTLYQTRIVTRRLNLDSGQLLPAGSAAAGETRQQLSGAARSA